MLISLLCAAVALALLFPETRLGGVLRRLLIEAPARTLDKLKRGHVLLALLVFAGLYAAYLIGKDRVMPCDLTRAMVKGADLRGADLRRAVLVNADLTRSDLTGALVRDTDLTDADLRGVKGLEIRL